MKKFAIALLLSAIAVPATANEITSIITDSVSLTVQGAAVQSTRIGSSYSVSGTNIKVDSSSSFGGITGGTATAAATLTPSGYEINTSGQAFSFSESGLIGDSVVTEQGSLSTNGRFDDPNLYGESTTQTGGSAGTLAGTLSPTGVATVTAGGPGTVGVGQRTVEMSVFQ